MIMTGKKVIITSELVEECKCDSELCQVAFGQETDRDIKEILGRTIVINQGDFYCLFDDEFGNEYVEIEVDGHRYNVPFKFFS